MQQYTDCVQTRAGTAVAGASVLVKTLAGVTATIYSDNGVTTQANPITTDSNGRFAFYAADGRYSLTISKTGVIDTQTLTDIVFLGDPDVELIIPCGSETGAVSTGSGKYTFRMPFAADLTAVKGSLNGAATSGTFTMDVNASGTSILSTKITIDAGEKTSVTAATQPVILTVSLAADEEISIDVDDAGSGDATGPKVTLLGYKTSF